MRGAVGVGTSPIPQVDGGILEESKEDSDIADSSSEIADTELFMHCKNSLTFNANGLGLHKLRFGTMSGVGSCNACKEDINFTDAMKLCAKCYCDYKLCSTCDWKLKSNSLEPE